MLVDAHVDRCGVGRVQTLRRNLLKFKLGSLDGSSLKLSLFDFFELIYDGVSVNFHFGYPRNDSFDGGCGGTRQRQA